MKVEQQPAYLLHARPFSETSLLVDVFTREHGRLMLLAKGARRGKSRWRGVLLPFRPLSLSWAGKGQLPTLTAAEQGGSGSSLVAPPQLRGQSLASGFYLNELLLRLLHRHDAHETLFERYHRAMAQLAQLADGQTTRRVLRVFEKNLLHHIGFGAVLDHDADTGEAISAQWQYHYVPEKGPVRVERGDNGGNGNGGGVAISGRALCALREEQFHCDRELHEAQRLMRALIDCQLHGRPLRCRRVLREMNQYRARDWPPPTRADETMAAAGSPSLPDQP